MTNDLRFQTSLRRFRKFRSRVVGGITRRGLSTNCWYMHIPKSGGTSLVEAISGLVPIDKKIGYVDAPASRRSAAILLGGEDSEKTYHEDGANCTDLFKYRQDMLIYYMSRNDMYVTGHILYSELAEKFFYDRYKFISLLRDPVKRTISNYTSAVFYKFIDCGFDEYLESDVCRRHALVNLRYFSGMPEIKPHQEGEALEKARRNMKKFAYVGRLEKIDNFQSAFKDIFGQTPVLKRYNKARQDKPDMSREQKARLEKICASDYELYQQAKDTWG